MTKWLALALGALLALGGAVSLWNGIDVIQSERGWASVIAGATALAGGVVTFGIFLVIRELQAIRASLMMVLESEPLPASAPAAPASPAVAVEPPAPAVAAPPVVWPVEPAPPAAEPAPEPVASAHAPKEPPPHESFDQIFPPVPLEPPPAPPAREPFRFRASGAALGLAAGAAAIGAFGRSRASDSAEAPQQAEPAAEAQPQRDGHEEAQEQAPQDQAQQDHAPIPHDVEALSVSEAELEETAAALRGESPAPAAQEHTDESQAPEVHQEEPSAPEPAATGDAGQPGGEPVAEEPPSAEVDETQASPGYAWLERALAREEGQKSPALEWLRSRPPTSLLIDPAAPAEEPQAPAEEPVSEPAPATGDGAAHDAHEASAHEASAEAPSGEHQGAQEEAQAEPAPAEPSVIGRYSSGGNEYTLYSDGAIDAQTEQGLFRFESMQELRAYIEAQSQQS